MTSAAHVIINGGATDIEFIDAISESDKENLGYDIQFPVNNRQCTRQEINLVRKPVAEIEPNLKNKFKEEQSNNQLKKGYVMAKTIVKNQKKKTNESEMKENCNRISDIGLHPQTKLNNVSTVARMKQQLYIPDIDSDCKDEFYQYFPIIIQYLWNRENNLKNSKSFLSKNNLSTKTRATLNNWMIQVHLYLNIRTESLHLSVAICDAFLSKSTIELTAYQLLGITALFIAAKVIERFPPSPSALCYLTEQTFKPSQLIKMERQVLSTLLFQIYIPIPHNFLTRGLLACVDISNTSKMEYMSYYLFDLILQDRCTADWCPSKRAAAAIYLSRLIFHGKVEPWTATLEYYTSYTAEDLSECVKIYASYLKKVEDNSFPHTAAFEKFASARYNQIALSPEIKKSLVVLLQQKQ